MSNTLLAIPGGASIALIVIAILLLFGGKKIPELMRGLGKGISEFKKGKNELDKEIDDTKENN
jgi:sec-independent protein translocase protein TatA|tara:strand:+ start:1541 stop:1729 length:189 start_codon:yes stop_codon:yes gene_type:complete